MSRTLSKEPLPSKQAMEISERLHAAAIHLLRRLRREDTAGIGPARLSALSVIVFGGPITLSELARAEQVKPPTMSRIVSGLEENGLARRASDRRDGRIARIHPTPRGRKLLHQGRYRRVAALAKRLATLTRKELLLLDQTISLLERTVGKWNVEEE